MNAEVLWEPFSGAIRVESVQDEAATGSFYRAPWPNNAAAVFVGAFDGEGYILWLPS